MPDQTFSEELYDDTALKEAVDRMANLIKTHATKRYVDSAVEQKQDKLLFDSTPTASSTNPVTSGGVKTALDTKQDTLIFDTKPTAESTKPVTSGGVYEAVSELKENLSSALTENKIITDIPKNAWIDGWINTSGKVMTSTASKTALIPMSAGQTVVVGTNNKNITIIGTTTADSIAIGDSVTVIQKTSAVGQYEEYSYTAPEDVNVVICVLWENHNEYVYESTVFATKESVNANLYEIKKLKLESGTIDTTAGSNTTSTASMRTPTFIDESIVKVSFENCKLLIYAYGQDGAFIGGYSASEGYTKDWRKYTNLNSPVYIDDLIKENYRLRLVFNRFVGEVSEENANANADVSIIKTLVTDKEEVYTVGPNDDFATFTEMLVALKDNTHKKIVYVSGGTYDIFEEMGGAEYMQTVDTSASWATLNYIVPPNTEIVGVGDVVLAWNPTDEQIIDQAHAFIFAPLNLMGNCKIKNIKIHCSNCRYGIHDETSGKTIYNGVTHEFENVEVIYTQSTYGVKYAYGAGHNKDCKYKFKNCLFSAAYAAVWSTHDWPAGAIENSVYEIDNCVFWDNLHNEAGNIRLSSSDTVGRLDDVKINACVFNSISFGTEGSADIKQGYKVTTMLCKPYTPSWVSHILEADRIAPTDYLVLG